MCHHTAPALLIGLTLVGGTLVADAHAQSKPQRRLDAAVRGEFLPVASTADEVAAAAAAAIAAQGAPVQLIAIASAARQVLPSVNYRLVLAVTENGKPRRAVTEVHWDPSRGFAPTSWAWIEEPSPSLVFLTAAPIDDLRGTLAAEVRFAQSHVLAARPRQGDVQPHLVGQRTCLLLVRPLTNDGTTPLSVSARSGDGKALGSIDLAPPAMLPKTIYHVDGVPEQGVDFTPLPGATSVIDTNRELQRLDDAAGTLLRERLQGHTLVEIQTADGQWVAEVHLPDGTGLDGRMIRAQSAAAYGSTIHYSGRAVTLSRGEICQFVCVRGQWIRDGEIENNGITYATDAWSGVLPAQWISPGLTLEFRQGSRSGELDGIHVGAPTELLIHTIDIGLLTAPRDRFDFANDPSAHREYYQTAPVGKLIVGQYAPLSLAEVMLPDGTLLTDADPGRGGWHEGTLRQCIGKELVSHGIDNANYGLHSTAGRGEDTHPYVAAQLTAHNSRGKYANGIQVHGGSGGNGIVTLDSSLHNEFSHEVGHNYGLSHYEGGFRGSVHRSADQPNSAWGWDADRNRFLPNFAAVRSGKDTCLDGQCQSPFAGRSYGMDAMAGGEPLSGPIRFTHYTPFSAAAIQRFLESKAVFDASSPTGFRKWNGATARMEPFRHRLDVTTKVTAAMADLGAARLAALLTDHDLVAVAMADGRWSPEIELPPAAPANRGRTVTIHHEATYPSTLTANGERIRVTRGFDRSYVSDGQRWNAGPPDGVTVERRPNSFGVPVTTLVGYYDPELRLRSYIYPALHGAYGFTYPDDADRLQDGDCHLRVETDRGVLRFRLASQRLATDVMNKFHVNVPTESHPRSVAVVCRGRVVTSRPIAAAAAQLAFTVQGGAQQKQAREK